MAPSNYGSHTCHRHASTFFRTGGLGAEPPKVPGGVGGREPPKGGVWGGAVAPPQRFVCDDGPGATTGRNERNERTKKRTDGRTDGRTNGRTNRFSVASNTETALFGIFWIHWEVS